MVICSACRLDKPAAARRLLCGAFVCYVRFTKSLDLGEIRHKINRRVDLIMSVLFGIMINLNERKSK